MQEKGAVLEMTIKKIMYSLNQGTLPVNEKGLPFALTIVRAFSHEKALNNRTGYLIEECQRLSTLLETRTLYKKYHISFPKSKEQILKTMDQPGNLLANSISFFLYFEKPAYQVALISYAFNVLSKYTHLYVNYSVIKYQQNMLIA